LHLANTLLLFLLLRKMTQQTWRSGFVAFLFALHPLHVESVAWISERKDVLSTLFWMLTLWAYRGYAQRGGPYRYLLALFAFVLGLMAKPMLVTLPFVLLLLDYWPLDRLQFKQGAAEPDNTAGSRPERTSLFYLFWEKAPFFVITGVFSTVTFITQSRVGAVESLQVLPITARITNGIFSYADYICKMIWPNHLAVIYPHLGTTVPIWQTAALGSLLTAISVVVFRYGVRYRYLAVGWLWYLGTLVPVIGIVQVGNQGMADRYTYVPLIGLFVIIAWGVPDLLARWQYDKIFLAVATGLLCPVLMLCTWYQTQIWSNDITLFEHALSVTSNNHMAHTQLGSAFLNQTRTIEAIAHCTKALEINPRHPGAHYNLGVALTQQGKINEAISHFSYAVRFKPDFAQAHNNLGEALAKRGKLEEATTHFSKALQSKPDWAEAHNNLGNALTQQGRLDQAIAQYTLALRLNPDYGEAHNNLALALAHQGKLKEAVSHYLEALLHKPDSAETHNNLAVALVNLGQLEPATYHYLRALELKPDYAEVHNNLGNLLAQTGRLDTATIHFSKALEINPDYAEAHNNLGVALARQKRFREAVAHFTEAVRLKPEYDQARFNLELTLEKTGKTQ
jgi:tetratricopeptide (TPR) repeat protein